MNNTATIKVEVVYANHERQQIFAVMVASDGTILDAIQQSGVLQAFPEINLHHQKIGIFSKIHSLSDGVSEGDRIEIYRPLTIDPKDARRRRAKRAAMTRKS